MSGLGGFLFGSKSDNIKLGTFFCKGSGPHHLLIFVNIGGRLFYIVYEILAADFIKDNGN